MYSRLLEILVDPKTQESLRLGDGVRRVGERTVSGLLESDSETFPIVNGIPRFVTTTDAKQRQTEKSFAFAWQRQTEFSSTRLAVSRDWLASRYGFGAIDKMLAYFSDGGKILDAGCGNGFSSSLWLTPEWSGEMWVGADISTAVDIAQERLGGILNTHFLQADVMELPFAEGAFDIVFSEGVLHHTPSTEAAFKALVPLLKRGGELMAYVYRRKAPIREHTDEHVRGMVSGLPPEEALELLRPLTHLGRALAELKAEIELPEDIAVLGIKAGRYDVHRLVYWHFAKAFWNEAYSFDESLYNNFDWYHPAYAHRHTEEEVRGWCEESSLSITHFDARASGITVRAVRY